MPLPSYPKNGFWPRVGADKRLDVQALLTAPLFAPLSLSAISPAPLHVFIPPAVGWSTRATNSANAGFGHVPSNPNMYEGAGYGNLGGEGPSIKAKMINLISAVRTLMRSKSYSCWQHDLLWILEVCESLAYMSSTVNIDQCRRVSVLCGQDLI
jgi:hypothetical protein